MKYTNTFMKIIDLITSHRVSEDSPLFDLAEKLRLLTLTNGDGATARKVILDSVNTEEVIAVGNNLSYKVFNKVEDPKEAIYIAGKDEVSSANLILRDIYLKNDSDTNSLDSLEVGDLIRSRCNGVNEVFMTGDEFQVTKILAKTDKFIFIEATCITRNKEFSQQFFKALIQGIRNIYDSNQNLRCTVAVYLPPLINNDNEKLQWNHVRGDMFNNWKSLPKSSVDLTIYNNVDDIISTTYGYAVTIEHSQGGEWDVVGVSMDVEGKQDIPKYWYTADTRAKKLLYVFT